MEKAAFKLENFRFPKSILCFDIPENSTLEVSFDPSGVYHKEKGVYDLTFVTSVMCEETGTEVVNVLCVAQFKFKEVISLDEIPDFFYPNSLAILFPYVRAFVSTVSLQANVKPVVLPTLNLRGLEKELRSKTIVE